MLLPWGTEAERARSEYIAAAVPGARVPDRVPLDQVAKLIAGAQFVVGVDTGLLHLAAALGRSGGRDIRRQQAGSNRAGRERAARRFSVMTESHLRSMRSSRRSKASFDEGRV